MKMKVLVKSLAVAALCMAGLQAQAADWSDTSISYWYGTSFKEPFVAKGADVAKNVVTLKHASGDKYGTNFFNMDMLMSNSVDSGATETYLVYRRLFDFGKITGKKFEFGPVRGLGGTVGFDLNTKNDPGYASRKRMFVFGPTFMIDVPGFLDVSLLLLSESNAPGGIPRYSYKTHAALTLAWGIPIGNTGLSYEGYGNYIAPKGKNEFGGPTYTETNLYNTIMYDASSAVGASKNTFKVGVGYQYWRNKFGNAPSAPGTFAHTPFVRAEYHF